METELFTSHKRVSVGRARHNRATSIKRTARREFRKQAPYGTDTHQNAGAG